MFSEIFYVGKHKSSVDLLTIKATVNLTFTLNRKPTISSNYIPV